MNIPPSVRDAVIVMAKEVHEKRVIEAACWQTHPLLRTTLAAAIFRRIPGTLYKPLMNDPLALIRNDSHSHRSHHLNDSSQHDRARKREFSSLSPGSTSAASSSDAWARRRRKRHAFRHGHRRPSRDISKRRRHREPTLGTFYSDHCADEHKNAELSNKHRSSSQDRWVHDIFEMRSPSPNRERTEGTMWNTRRGAWRSRAGGIYLAPDDEHDEEKADEDPSGAQADQRDIGTRSSYHEHKSSSHNEDFCFKRVSQKPACYKYPWSKPHVNTRRTTAKSLSRERSVSPPIRGSPTYD